jgi:hypothetical protein
MAALSSSNDYGFELGTCLIDVPNNASGSGGFVASGPQESPHGHFGRE